MLQFLSIPLQNSVCFCGIPLPVVTSTCLTAAYRALEDNELTLFLICNYYYCFGSLSLPVETIEEFIVGTAPANRYLHKRDSLTNLLLNATLFSVVAYIFIGGV